MAQLPPVITEKLHPSPATARGHDEEALRRTLALTDIVRKTADRTSSLHILRALPHGTVVTTVEPIFPPYGSRSPGARWMRDLWIGVGEFSDACDPGNPWDHYATVDAEQLAEVLHRPGTTVEPFEGSADDVALARRDGCADPDREAADLAFIRAHRAVREAAAAWGR